MADASHQERRPPLRLLVSRGSAASDGDLVQAFLDGDDGAFGALVERYQGLVFSLMRRYVARPEDGRDLAQKAFLKAFAAARRVFSRLRAQPSQFKPWLLRIAINVAKNHLRDRRRWRLDAIDELKELPHAGVGAQERLEEQERKRRTQEAVFKLPRRQREVLTLRVDGGLAFAEVADALGITENNAKVHFHHAVQRLKALLAEEGS